MMALGSYFLFQSGVENCLVRDDFFSLSLRVAGYMIRSMSPSPFKGHIFFFFLHFLNQEHEGNGEDNMLSI